MVLILNVMHVLSGLHTVGTDLNQLVVLVNQTGTQNAHRPGTAIVVGAKVVMFHQIVLVVIVAETAGTQARGHIVKFILLFVNLLLLLIALMLARMRDSVMVGLIVHAGKA